MLERVAVITPNETEARLLTGMSIDDEVRVRAPDDDDATGHGVDPVIDQRQGMTVPSENVVGDRVQEGVPVPREPAWLTSAGSPDPKQSQMDRMTPRRK